MYKYADSQGWCDKDYRQYVKIKRDDDDEHGVPFSDTDLKILWDNKADETAEMLLIMCYSGWRISEYISLEVNMEKSILWAE